MKDLSFSLQKASLSILVSFTISVEIVDGYRSYRNNHHYYSGPGGGLADWEWWQIALLCVGLIFLCCFVAICGQLFCSTECQEEMCCGESEA